MARDHRNLVMHRPDGPVKTHKLRLMNDLFAPRSSADDGNGTGAQQPVQISHVRGSFAGM